MGNIKNFNFNKLDVKLSNSDYWDFFLATDEYNNCGAGSSSGCTAVWYDFNNLSTYANSAYTATSIYSLTTWAGAVNTGYTFNTIGLTGIDNGLITFEKTTGDTSNQTLLSAITGSTLIIPSGNTKLHLTRVTGTTGDYIYPITIITGGTSGTYSNLCGGFYQGYYKLDGYTYEVLPTRVNESWSAEIWLKPQDLCNSFTGTTLNDDYPNNKGFFFYMGTRAENKYWNIWDGADTGCTRDCTVPTGCTDTLSEWCTIPKESEMSIIGDYGVIIPLDPPQLEIDLITNPFLIYGRALDDRYPLSTASTGTFINEIDVLNTNTGSTCSRCSACGNVHDGLGSQTACSYDGNGIVVVNTAKHVTNTTNPFLIYGRGHEGRCNCFSCGGNGDGYGRDTVCTFSGFTSQTNELDYNLDIIDNAIGFRIKDNGSIGYRLMTVTGQCVTATTGVVSYISGVTIEEGYSPAGVITNGDWNYVVIKYITEKKTDCELKTAKPRKGRLSFYVNGKLKYFIDEFDEFIARRLMEYKDKQLGVPFNFSLGGGSQGLLESQTFDGLDPNDRNLPIQENFAGTFIGGISQFKFNLCELTYEDIQNNYLSGSARY